MRGYRVREAHAEDLEQVLGVQHRAFGRVARMFASIPRATCRRSTRRRVTSLGCSDSERALLRRRERLLA